MLLSRNDLVPTSMAKVPASLSQVNYAGQPASSGGLHVGGRHGLRTAVPASAAARRAGAVRHGDRIGVRRSRQSCDRRPRPPRRPRRVGHEPAPGRLARWPAKGSGRSELTLAAEAVRAALDDAGLRPQDVDGPVAFTMDANPEITVAQASGVAELGFFSRVHYGGGAACATVQQAAMAVAIGVAEVVVCYWAFNEQPGHRFGTGLAVRRRRRHGLDGCRTGCPPRRHGWPSDTCTPTGSARTPSARSPWRTGGMPRPIPPPMSTGGRAPRPPLDRRAAVAAGLLSGDGRRPGPGGDLRRAGPRPAAPARDDQLLSRRPDRAPRRWAWSPGSCGVPAAWPRPTSAPPCRTTASPPSC